MKTQALTRAALLATAVLLSGCASMPKYLAWLKLGDKPELDVRPMQVSTETAEVAPTDRLYRSAVAAIEERDYGLALERLQQARERSPQDVRVLNALAVTYDKLGRFDLSARFYAEATAAAPGSPIVQANLAYSHLMQRRFEDVRTASLTPGKQFAELRTAPKPVALNTAPKTLTLAKAEAPMLKRATPALVGRPLMLVDAGGAGAQVKIRLASLGWSVHSAIERADASKESRILYPAEHRTVAMALANTLPFRATLSVCQDNCRGVVLVLGEDAKWTG
jgi:tetratricopeptide (TPR) repeat protein